MNATADQLEVTEKVLRFIYPDLRFRREQLTAEAAAFALEVVKRVDHGSRSAMAAFRFANVTRWSQLPLAAIRAARDLLADNEFQKSLIAQRLIAAQHQRNLQAHLDNPDVMPCPGFR